MESAERVFRVQQEQDRFNERIPIGAKSSIDRNPPSASEVQRVFRAHGMEIVGPPLKV